jgi:hypothetical protein
MSDGNRSVCEDFVEVLMENIKGKNCVLYRVNCLVHKIVYCTELTLWYIKLCIVQI